MATSEHQLFDHRDQTHFHTFEGLNIEDMISEMNRTGSFESFVGSMGLLFDASDQSKQDDDQYGRDAIEDTQDNILDSLIHSSGSIAASSPSVHSLDSSLDSSEPFSPGIASLEDIDIRQDPLLEEMMNQLRSENSTGDRLQPSQDQEHTDEVQIKEEKPQTSFFSFFHHRVIQPAHIIIGSAGMAPHEIMNSKESNDHAANDEQNGDSLSSTASPAPVSDAAGQMKTTELMEATEQEIIVDGIMKPAKSRKNEYKSVPSSLLCNPYKYDLKLSGTGIGKLVTDEGKHIELQLVKADTMETPLIAKDPMSVDSVMLADENTVIFRITLHICSFHFKKREFRIVLSDIDNSRFLYISPAFRTYARKRERNGIQSNMLKQKRQKLDLHNKVKCEESEEFSREQQNPSIKEELKPQQYERNKQSESIKTQISSPPAVLMPTLFNVIPYTPAPVIVPPMDNSTVSFEEFARFQQQLFMRMQHNQGPASRSSLPDDNADHGDNKDNDMMASLERTSKAIELLSSLTPMERHALQSYMHCQAMISHQSGRPSTSTTSAI